MRERLKTSLSDELGLLLEIGADLIGDVQVLPPGASPETEREVYALTTQDAGLSFAKVRDEVFGSRASGLPGVQDKVSSRMLNAPVRYAGYDYILKLNPTGVPFAVENEAFFLGLARQCDIATADFQLMTDSLGERALRLRRFDRLATGAGHRLALEDGAQVLDVYPAAKYEVDFLEMAQALVAHCAARPAAGLQLFRQLVFNWLIGNGDAHAKNYSILEGTGGDWVISPAYDLLCTRFYDDRTLALTVQGKYHALTRKLLVETAGALGVSERAAHKVIDRQLATLADLPDQIVSGALPFAQNLNNETGKFLRKRAKALA
jgi:serine/threonine-protein kinase HipA